jgi:hypothetical protein
MRSLLEILSIIALVLIGWTRPFSEQSAMVFPWMGRLAVTSAPTPAPGTLHYPTAMVRPAATPLDRSWMFGPSVLDPPEKK